MCRLRRRRAALGHEPIRALPFTDQVAKGLKLASISTATNVRIPSLRGNHGDHAGRAAMGRPRRRPKSSDFYGLRDRQGVFYFDP